MRKREAGNNRFAKLDQAIEQDNENFLNNETQVQQQIARQQDEDLDKLHTNVKKIGAMGETISEELKTQGKYAASLLLIKYTIE